MSESSESYFHIVLLHINLVLECRKFKFSASYLTNPNPLGESNIFVRVSENFGVVKCIENL